VKTPRLFRTTSFRLTALYSALFAASTGLLFGIVYWIATDALDQQARLAVQNELASLAGTAAPQSTSQISAEITQRLQGRNPQGFFYSLRSSSGETLVGDLPGADAFDGWRKFPSPFVQSGDADLPDGSGHLFLALGQRLPDGSLLTVATDMHPVVEAEEAIARSFAWAAGATLLLALVGGIVLSRGFLSRIDEINRTTHAIMHGNLAERIRIGATGDELDRLGGNLNEMLDRIQHLMEGLRQVSSDIAHDLRTPLSRLKQRLETARDEARSADDYAVAIDEALQDADTALATFGALLRIAQIESGTRRAQFADVDLSDLLSNLAMTYTAVAEDLGGSLDATVAEGIHVCGDRELLTQLFVNLIENALRHTPMPARIGLSLGAGADGPLAEVCDNGPGIPETERSNVFKRFYRLESDRGTPGSGLGLALVAAVADLHDVRIALSDNRPGLKVTLHFPCRRR